MGHMENNTNQHNDERDIDELLGAVRQILITGAAQYRKGSRIEGFVSFNRAQQFIRTFEGSLEYSEYLKRGTK